MAQPTDPNFTLFVSSVEGRAVSRFGARSGTLIGARYTTEEEMAAGAGPIVWDTERVVPLLEDEHARYRREYASAIRCGDLRACTPEQWTAWRKHQAQRERAEAKKAEVPRQESSK